MINTDLVLSDKEFVKRELAKKNVDAGLIDELESVLLEIKTIQTVLNELGRKRNEWSRDDTISVEEKRNLRNSLIWNQKELDVWQGQANKLLYEIPCLPDADAPVGEDEAGNVITFESSDHYLCTVENPAPHWEIGEKLGILDMELGSKVSGPSFAMYKGCGAKLIRVLVNYCMAIHEGKYSEILPPHLVSTQSLTYTGHLPKFSQELYTCEKDGLMLIPTAEVPLTAAFAKTVFSSGELPKYVMGYTAAFRREVGSTGKDTRGLQRIHEFHKVELLKITEPSMVAAELDDLLRDCLKIIEDLRLKYRVVDLCTCEMGDKYARCYDIEVFCPGLGKWLEVASIGHFSDFQARRAEIKYKTEKGKIKYACTLNGSGMATPRVWAAIIETYQQPDGSVKIPEALAPYMGCDTISALPKKPN